MKILVVDDEPLIAMDIAAILREAGDHDIRLAASVTKALDILRQESFDAAVLDMNLRGRPLLASPKLGPAKASHFWFCPVTMLRNLPKTSTASPCSPNPASLPLSPPLFK